MFLSSTWMLISNLIMLISLPFSAMAKEAFFVEGGMGSPISTVYGLDDIRIEPSGDLSYLRFHFPVKQTKTQIFSIALSNQYYDGLKKNTASESHLLSYSAPGLGFSYRYRFLMMGADYQFAEVRQSLVSTSPNLKNYNFNMPNLYAGFLFRLGSLGFGVNYYTKTGTIPKKETGLTQDRDYKESGAVFSLSYHWSGTPKSFFRGLFRKR